MEQGGNNSRLIHFADVAPVVHSQTEIEQSVGEKEGRYLNVKQDIQTELQSSRSASSRSYLQNEEPQFTFGVENGLAAPNKVRGRRGTAIKPEDMIAP